MKIVIREGCTSNSIIVDGKQLADYTKQEQDMLIEELIVKMKLGISRGELQICDLIRLFQYDDFKCAEPCDQCGDSSTTTTYNI